MIYLIGETIDKDRAYYGAEKGSLIPITRGVYVDADDDVDDTLFAHAVRVARFLYPNTYLHGFSALALSPTRDGRLFLAGRRGQRTRLRGLEIVQTRAPEKPDIESIVIEDPRGELPVERAAPLQQFLESFRARSEAGAALGPAEKNALGERLISDFGADGAVERLWKLGLANKWRQEAEAAERFLFSPRREAPPRETVFHVGWHRAHIGRLIFDRIGWRWEADKEASLSPVRVGVPGALPHFIESLLPEGWLKDVIDTKSDRDAIASGKRYLSNMIVSGDAKDIEKAPEDRLHGTLDAWSEGGAFTGEYEGPTAELQGQLEERLAELYAKADTPRLSGVQIKAPMTLTTDGALRPATDGPFTHILKPSPGGDLLDLPLIEQACLRAAEACGLRASRNALVRFSDDLPDALLVERFDIRANEKDRRRYALEDMASVRGVRPEQKYDGSVEQTARSLRAVSTEPDEDLTRFFKRALFAWLIADGDWHLKNMAVLRVAQPNSEKFDVVSLAPVYDCVTTRAFARFSNDRFALTLNGKRDKLRLDDFRRFGATIGLGAERAQEFSASFADKFDDHLSSQKPTNATVARAMEIWRGRLQAIKQDL